MNYYEVETKCGHVRKGHYIIKKFAVKAENGKEAAVIARRIPRVKHDMKSAIVSVTKISEEQFEDIRKQNNDDPFLNCKSSWEQKVYCDLIDEIQTINPRDEKEKKEKNKRRAKINNLLIKESRRMILEYQY